MALRGQRQLCLLCELRQLIVAQPGSLKAQRRPAIPISLPLSPSLPSWRQHYGQSPLKRRSGQRRWNTTVGTTFGSQRRGEPTASAIPSKSHTSSTLNALEPERELFSIAQETKTLIGASSLPTEDAILSLLGRCQQLSQVLAEGTSPINHLLKNENTATSALLSLQEPSVSKPSPTSSPVPLSDTFKKRAPETLPRLSTQILRDPKVFITPPILQIYVSIQSVLKRPEHLPEIFSLYASTPIPNPSSSPITYSPANPKSHTNAIPGPIANLALEASIAKKDLPLILSIIDTTFCSPAFYRSKFLRKAAVPMTGLALAPVASYAIATYFAEHYQNTMDTGMATNLAFAAIVSYIGFTAVIGIVAVTTANDQMVRVTWVGGVPLRERWLREEERAALDKVAMAWGFREEWKRGMEEGVEWESLREFIGRRGMVLDASNLMQGME